MYLRVHWTCLKYFIRFIRLNNLFIHFNIFCSTLPSEIVRTVLVRREKFQVIVTWLVQLKLSSTESLRLRRNLNFKLWSPKFPVAITGNISCKTLQKEDLRLCLNSRDYLLILLFRNFYSGYDNLKRMIVNNEYYLLLAAMLLLMVIDEKQNHAAITMPVSMKHSILYADHLWFMIIFPKNLL